MALNHVPFSSPGAWPRGNRCRSPFTLRSFCSAGQIGLRVGQQFGDTRRARRTPTGRPGPRTARRGRAARTAAGWGRHGATRTGVRVRSAYLLLVNTARVRHRRHGGARSRRCRATAPRRRSRRASHPTPQTARLTQDPRRSTLDRHLLHGRHPGHIRSRVVEFPAHGANCVAPSSARKASSSCGNRTEIGDVPRYSLDGNRGRTTIFPWYGHLPIALESRAQCH